MSNVLRADPEAIREAGQRLETAAADIDQRLLDLADLLTYLQGEWTGEASDAYATAQQGWNASMAGLHRVVFEAGTLLAAISARYETTEAAVVRAASAG